MLGGVRRFGVARVLRASALRAPSRTFPQLARWQKPATPVVPQLVRSFYGSSILRSQAEIAAQEQQVEDAAETSNESQASESFENFADLERLELIDPRIIRTLSQKMNITSMTDVQRMTIKETLQGQDVLAQAKTGTGKTVAFLLPVLQNIMNDPTFKQSASRGSYSRLRNNNTSASDIRSIIISPTRELAEQIATEARKVAAGTGVVVQTAVGGTQKKEGLRRIQREGCHVLIGTPGRLKDILSDPYNGVRAPTLSSFVLDEADRLLDDGFSQEIMEIQSLLPDPRKVDRQTLMFSATVPKEVMHMVRRTMKPDYKFVQTVREDEVPTHQSVPQKVVYLNGFENAFPAILELAKKAIAEAAENPKARPFKAIVYFNATAQTNLAFETFRELVLDPRNPRGGHPLGNTAIVEMHSRLTQSRRTSNSEFFRRKEKAILFSSDVTARGMDFPDVTHVIQVGVPRDRPSYIHRLGRTARAKKDGQGWLFIHDGEHSSFNQKLGDLPIEEDAETLETAAVDMTRPGTVPSDSAAATTLSQVKYAMSQVSDELKAVSYRSQLGPLMGVFQRKRELVASLNDLAVHGYGMPEPPTIAREVAHRMGISNTPGLRQGESYSRRPQFVDDFSSRGNRGARDRFDQSDFGRGSFSRRRSGGRRFEDNE
ncbi:hypothetical protein ASPZODRAFT_89818 [Penicilliopsis zonata CBS 506.65]|uniref:ATP-dependent RNA helicase n=1 Tax=Penicilliopsis zonata CBS 506.65 TaxID=1073090 RepID=A0A1L9SSF4_9EURO|nr:hypothetical protein ASPZODRAFT_89818 [Penicilliopsis zonata CBS 506.65]OJJ50044.1 hypothetical protein ASPZODRAFT_89818 [Penicilliopsis zonata CBS 506.65]